jgi:hypothetical protein
MAVSAPAHEGLSSWLYLSVGMFIASVVLYYRLDDGVSSLLMLTTHSAWICVALLAICVVSVTRLGIGWQRAGGLASKSVRLSLAMSLVSIALMFVLGEGLVRFFAEPDPEGPLVGDLRLLPRNWHQVATYRRSNWERDANASVFVFDSQLGWTIPPNGKGTGAAHERIFSSAEGARVGGEGFRFGDRSVRTRIALVGNSYVFGSDVDYEDTWGFYLQQRLGTDVQVQNFGVPGYGVDQAYLRYLKDVLERRPDVAILGLISHDLLRTTMVYYAVGFPGGTVHGAKPRFTVKNGQPTLLNAPLPPPKAVYAVRPIQNLPFIDYDRTYRPTEWQPHWYEFSYLLRFGVSWCATCGVFSSPSENEETVTLNGAILHAFVQKARAVGTTPIVLFLPSYTEFRDASGRLSGTPLVGVLKEAGVDFIDLTTCIERVDERERFTSGWHFTPQANSILADCLRDIVVERVPGLGSHITSLR